MRVTVSTARTTGLPRANSMPSERTRAKRKVGEGASRAPRCRRRVAFRKLAPVEEDGEGIDAGDAVPVEQRPPGDRADGAGRVDGRHVEAHRDREAPVPRDLAEEGPPDRMVHGPCASAQRRPGRDVPELEPAGVGEGEQHRGGDREHREVDCEQPLAVETGGEGADRRAEQHGGEGAGEEHHGHQERRAGLVERVEADGEGLEPADRSAESPREPDPEEVGPAEQREAAGAGARPGGPRAGGRVHRPGCAGGVGGAGFTGSAAGGSHAVREWGACRRSPLSRRERGRGRGAECEGSLRQWADPGSPLTPIPSGVK